MTPEELQTLVGLDSRGFLAGAEESMGDFLARVGRVRALYADFDAELAKAGSADIFGLFHVGATDRIAPEILSEVSAKTEELYGFSVEYVPGFYLHRGMGIFWGGCMLGDPESGFSVFMLRAAFRNRKKFLNYRREELLAHELCHVARQSMNEPQLEEYFAYRTSASPLRRYLGNCFISDSDTWGFIIPVLLLPVAELIKLLWNPGFPAWIFWLAALVFPLWLLCRNARSRYLVNKALRNVASAGASKPLAVLFRCTFSEVCALGKMSGREILQMAEKKRDDSPRWAVIAARFFNTGK